MITTISDLKSYISADKEKYTTRRPQFLGRILNDEAYHVLRFLRCLRKLEYYSNNKQGCFRRVLFYYYFLRHRMLELKYGIRISPNIVGRGIYIPHIGGIIINALSVGDNLIINSGAIIGNKSNADNKPTIGNNVEVCVGAKIIGKIKIGNNAIIAPNSVVIADVPDNAIVSGIPAKIIKYR